MKKCTKIYGGVLILLSQLSLIGCGSSGGEPAIQDARQVATAVDELIRKTKFDDPALNACFADRANEHQWSSLEAVSELNCDQRGVQSIVGIERLDALKILSLLNNPLDVQSVDVLKSATSIVVYRTPLISELTFIDNNFQQCIESANKQYGFQVDTLSCVNKGIESIEHIEYLPALTTIDLSENVLSYDSIEILSSLENATVVRSSLISELDFSDPAFKGCVENTRAAYAFQVSQLNCAGMPISDIVDLALVPNVNYLDLDSIELPIEVVYKLNSMSSINVKRSLLVSEIDFADENFDRCMSLDYGQRFAFALNIIDCKGHEIESVNNLHLFPNLHTIDLSGNQLSVLDTTQNLKLTHLNASYNKIASFDFSNNAQLERLYIVGNATSSVEFSNHPMLELIDMHFNNIESLDVTGMPNLLILNVEDNQLLTLDVSTNIALVDLRASFNQLKVVDLDKNTALERLDLISNQLDIIDVSKHIQLKRLSVNDNNLDSLYVGMNLELDYLDASRNNLSYLEVTNNNYLTRLFSDENQLSEIILPANCKLQTLTLTDNKLDNIDLSSCTHLEIFAAIENELSILDFSSNVNLQQLLLVKNNIETINLDSNPKLNLLWLRKNPLTPETNDYLLSLDLEELTL